ncbi:MAG: hypothetical protein AAF799_38545 [Myxococcota bacterium]
MPAALVILVPGLLGFERLGRLSYFTDVEPVLRGPFAAAGIQLRVHVVSPPPSSAVETRAARLAEAIAEQPGDEPIHIVGHSTGGLDTRLLLSPGISLPTEVDVEAAARRVRSAVSLSTPHHGAPLAVAFTGVQGHRWMTLISRLLTRLLRSGSGPRRTLIETGMVVLHLDRIAGVDPSVCDPLCDALEGAALDPAIVEWLSEIGQDGSLLEQLTPGAVARLTATLQTRPTVRYGSVATMAPPPRLRSLVSFRSSRYARASAGLYALLHRLAGAASRRSSPMPSGDELRTLERELGAVPSRRDNDGFVPTRSQVWGSLITAVHGDHLDLMGYYGGAPGRPRLDMLASGAPFDSRDFEATWSAIAGFMLDNAA